MKRIVCLVLLLLLAISCEQEERKYAGTKTPYAYQENVTTLPPEGYYPFHMDYTGRHGSRFIGEPIDKQIVEVLLMAKIINRLTKKRRLLTK